MGARIGCRWPKCGSTPRSYARSSCPATPESWPRSRRPGDMSSNIRSRSRGKNREWTRMDANLLRMYASSVYSRPFVVPFLVTDQTGECSLPSLKLALAKVLVDQKAWLKLTCEESRRRCDSAFCRWQSQSTFAHGNVGPQRHVCLA